MKKRYLVLSLALTCLASIESYAQKTAGDTAKTLSGISIIGNKDAPKSLYIVPWRGSELGMETDLNSSLLNEGLHAVDKDVFMRELSFQQNINVPE